MLLLLLVPATLRRVRIDLIQAPCVQIAEVRSPSVFFVAVTLDIEVYLQGISYLESVQDIAFILNQLHFRVVSVRGTVYVFNEFEYEFPLFKTFVYNVRVILLDKFACDFQIHGRLLLKIKMVNPKIMIRGMR